MDEKSVTVCTMYEEKQKNRWQEVSVCIQENAKRGEALRNSYKSELLAIFFRITLDFFFDSAIIGFQNPYM